LLCFNNHIKISTVTYQKIKVDSTPSYVIYQVMKISESTHISMPVRNLISIVAAVAVGVWAYFGIVERINNLETSKQLMEADLLKRAEQKPKNLEMLMLIEMNAKMLEKHQKQLDENIHTKVLLTEATKKIEKLQQDVEKLVRKNGK